MEASDQLMMYRKSFRIRVGSAGFARLSVARQGSSEQKSQTNPNAHESEGREKQHEHAATDSALAILGGPRRVGVAHRAALRECGDAPQSKYGDENEEPSVHFTPKWIMRSASGKKKKYMMTKHADTEITSSQRMSARSNFRCMK